MRMPLYNSNSFNISISSGKKKAICIQGSAGKAKTRISLSIGSLKTPRIARVAVKRLDISSFPMKLGFIKKHFWVSLKVKGEIILVNINSLSKRFGIAKKEIMQSKEAGGTGRFLGNIMRRRLETVRSGTQEATARLEEKLDKGFKSENALTSDEKAELFSTIEFARLQRVAIPTKEAQDFFLDKTVTHLKASVTVTSSGDDAFIDLPISLGKGSFKTVNVAISYINGEDLAHARLIDVSNENIANIRREAEFLQEFHGTRGIVGTHRIIWDNSVGIFQKKYSHGELVNFMDELRTPRRKRLAAILTSDIAHGLSRIHDKNILHRDIKPQNILIGTDDNGKIIAVITDFGVSVRESGDSKRSEIKGTLPYLSPEFAHDAIHGQPNSAGKPADVWAFGMVLYQMHVDAQSSINIFNSLPGDSNSQKMEFANRLNNLATSPEAREAHLASYPEPDKVDKPIEHLIWRCLRPVPADRPTAQELSISFDTVFNKQHPKEERFRSPSISIDRL